MPRRKAPDSDEEVFDITPDEGGWIPYVEASVEYILSGKLKIRSKKGIKPLLPNSEQRAVLHRILYCAKNGLPCRIIVLKARQVGISTVVAAFFYTLTSMMRGLRAQVAAHNIDGCRALFNIYKFYKLTDERKPKTTYDSKTEIVFRDTYSGLQVSVADSDLGRGDMINLFHGSEYGFWTDPEDTLETILSCVPENFMSIAILESTGESGTDFEHRYREADKQLQQHLAGEKDEYDNLIKEPDWLPMFFPWYLHEEYHIVATPEETRSVLRSDDPDEKTLLALGASVSALAWRRRQLKSRFNGSAERFKAQFPATIDEAFAASDKSFFSPEALEYYKQFAVPPMASYEVHLSEDKRTEVMIDDKEGRLRVYRPPVTGHRYVIGADAAGESEHGLDARYKSQSALVVVDEIDGEIVAAWNGFVNGHQFGDICVAIGYHYNTALIVPEREKHGYAAILRIHGDLHYPRIYQRERHDTVEQAESDLLGWATDKVSRAVMLDVFQRLVQEYRVTIPDQQIVDQMRVFCNVGGKFKAKIGQRDDLVMATGIALVVASKGKSWGIKDRASAAREKRLNEMSPYIKKPQSRIHPEMFGGIYKSPVRRSTVYG